MEPACEEIRFTSEAPEWTEALARSIGQRLDGGSLLALSGDLGAGKTAFVRGLAAGLGCEEGVSSPTYTLAHEYPGRLTLHHLDAWMAGREAAFLAAGGEELLDGDGVCAIEWAGQVGEWLPPTRLEVQLSHLGPSRRAIVLRRLGGGATPFDRAWAWARDLSVSGPDSLNPALAPPFEDA
jgi:tRNA threonylcarbamoyladenosine biosynthesis protein TsaE